jgi:hypothetical protein
MYWPRPEKDWKEKEFLIATRSTSHVRAPRLDDIARWAPNSKAIHWSAHGGRVWGPRDKCNVGVEEYTGIVEHAERMKWDILLA